MSSLLSQRGYRRLSFRTTIQYRDTIGNVAHTTSGITSRRSLLISLPRYNARSVPSSPAPGRVAHLSCLGEAKCSCSTIFSASLSFRSFSQPKQRCCGTSLTTPSNFSCRHRWTARGRAADGGGMSPLSQATRIAYLTERRRNIPPLTVILADLLVRHQMQRIVGRRAS